MRIENHDLGLSLSFSTSTKETNLEMIDVNQRPLDLLECEEEAGVSSISSIKRDDNWSRGISDQEEDASRKKLRLSKDQAAVLEQSFKEHTTLNPKQKQALAKQLNLRPRQVEVWFQNRRARTKLKQTEVDCEFLKRCCHNLTEDNRRLQKEVQDLRAIKMSPQFYMHMAPPTTLTMCPSCERISSPSANNSVASVASTTTNIDTCHHPLGIPINP
ncbi:hypothetical protein GIB67_015582 [Kingdonia uniflora]|uniref:Homeobox domain-containing protein n=1 Tax=Kingdonia uniflora TaxID=39325 RepID=A0A7J7LUB3_9MAGN|nr:hypothetical protein GIB67_015582 [Kingdonia uniflora]